MLTSVSELLAFVLHNVLFWTKKRKFAELVVCSEKFMALRGGTFDCLTSGSN